VEQKMASEIRQRIDVGHYALYLACAGAGRPVVVCDAGLDVPGASDPAWATIATAVAQFTRVCCYDRAGLGQSDPAPRPRDAEALVRDLATILTLADIPPPYVLVGHSLGGMTMRMYTRQYPAQVAGMVLVDTSHEDVTARFDAIVPESVRRKGWEQSQVNHEGIDLMTYQDQYDDVGPLPDVPIWVISRGIAPNSRDAEGWPVEKTEPIWHELQAALVVSAPQGQHLIAEQSGHNIVKDQPDVVIAAIHEVVSHVRSRH